jgi:hypothetical protein
MNDLLQSGQHPEADQLSAFAEHALPAHEYEQTLAHLAVCPDCRSIVALSMPPIDDAPQPQPVAVHKPWFLGWKLAFPVTAAVAALVILIVETRTTGTRPRANIPTQEAELHSPAPVPHPEEEAPVPASKPPVPYSLNAATNAPPTRSAPALKAAIRSASPSDASPENQRKTIETSARHVLATEDSQPSNAPSGAVGGGIYANTAGPLSQNIVVNGAAVSATSSTSATTMAGRIGGPVPQTATMPAPPPAGNASAVVLGQASSGRQITGLSAVHGVALGVRGTVLTQTPLPSRLPAISVVSVAHRQLAIDSRNALFLSTDDGKNWKAISPQWQGHAIRVALVSSISTAQPAAVVTAAAPVAGFIPKPAATDVQLSAKGSTLTGTVTDPSGANVPNADVIITRKGTSDSRSVKTDTSGKYLVDNLLPGDYQVAARALGFKEAVSTLNVAVSEPLLANFTLDVGATTETVEVQASPISLAEIPSSVNGMLLSSANDTALPVFEITTAEGEHWTSADGQTWKRK